MAATKQIKSGPNEPITTFQVKRIMGNCKYNEDIKEEWVQWVTGDVNRTSLKSITQAQASQIIRAQEGSTQISTKIDDWGSFNDKNPKHRVILSLLRQCQWTVLNDRHGEVADMNRLAEFLKSDKSPDRIPLKDMSDKQLERLIVALGKIVKHVHK